jgi:hypothetical protein
VQESRAPSCRATKKSTGFWMNRAFSADHVCAWAPGALPRASHEARAFGARQNLLVLGLCALFLGGCPGLCMKGAPTALSRTSCYWENARLRSEEEWQPREEHRSSEHASKRLFVFASLSRVTPDVRSLRSANGAAHWGQRLRRSAERHALPARKLTLRSPQSRANPKINFRTGGSAQGLWQGAEAGQSP